MKKLKKSNGRVRNIKELITEGYELSNHVKDLNSRLGEIKALIRQHAESVEKSYMRGHNRSCVTISDVDKFTIDVRKFKRAVSSPKVFLDSVVVPITTARSLLGNAKFERLAEKETIKYNRVQFHDIDDEN